MNAFDEDLDHIAIAIKNLGFSQETFYVTGSTGLVGSILVKALVWANRKYSLGNKIVAHVRNLEKANTIFRGYAEISYYVGDVCNPIDYVGHVDYIIHAASETKSSNMAAFPVETLWTTLCGSKNVLEFAKIQHIQKMVYLSSMEAFGAINIDGRSSEKMLGYLDLKKSRTCYPESKRMVENMCACYAAEYNTPVTVARLAQTFGAGTPSNDTRVFSQFAHSAIDGKNIILHTQGLSCGNYVYTADAATAIFTLLKKGAIGDCYTIANEESSMRIRDMADMVTREIANGKINVEIDIPEHDNFGYAADTKLRLDASKMRSLGWEPHVGLKDSYKRMISYWKES